MVDSTLTGSAAVFIGLILIGRYGGTLQLGLARPRIPGTNTPLISGGMRAPKWGKNRTAAHAVIFARLRASRRAGYRSF